MIQSRGVFGRFLGPLLKPGLPLTKNVIKLLAKSYLIPLGLTSADAGIHKIILGPCHSYSSFSALPNHPSLFCLHNNTILIISNDEMKEIIRIIS